MKKQQFTLLILLCVAASLTVGCGDSHSVPTFNKLAFISERTVSPATPLFVMNLDGSSVTPIPFSTTSVGFPSVSADLKTVAFLSWNDDNVWVSNADGSTQTSLTTDGESYAPRISPNGKKIVYSHNDGTQWGIWIMNADGSGTLNLTSVLPTGMTDCYVASFSADSSLIVFTCYSNNSQSTGLYTVKADGTNTTTVATQSGYFDTPAFTPDGKQILFINYPGASAQSRHGFKRGHIPHRRAAAPTVSTQGLSSINLDGSNQTLLVANVYEAQILNSTLYYTLYDTTLSLDQIYKANLDGSGSVSLSDGTAYDYLGLSSD